MLLIVVSVVLQLAAFVVQGIQCWQDARRRPLCPGCSSPGAALPACGRGTGASAGGAEPNPGQRV
jgi:hypothetical protein